ncbi:MAG: cupin domain-containing protein [Spirulinaceae cyanobacterium]
MAKVSNILALPQSLPQQELFEVLLKRDRVFIERIISTGQSTPPVEWLDQETAEWVILLQGQAELAFETGVAVSLSVGDYLFIPPHQKHRVAATSVNPPCIWLAIHLS